MMQKAACTKCDFDMYGEDFVEGQPCPICGGAMKVKTTPAHIEVQGNDILMANCTCGKHTWFFNYVPGWRDVDFEHDVGYRLWRKICAPGAASTITEVKCPHCGKPVHLEWIYAAITQDRAIDADTKLIAGYKDAQLKNKFDNEYVTPKLMG